MFNCIHLHSLSNIQGFLMYGRSNKVLCIISWITDIIYLSVFSILSLPFLFGAIFIFIPTVITYLTVSLILLSILMMINEANCDYFECIKQIYRHKKVYIFCFHLLPVIHLLIICIIPFYQEQTWRESYDFGFMGHYCPITDRFSFTKMYDADITILIVSWFIF